jgi:hypothetical protein
MDGEAGVEGDSLINLGIPNSFDPFCHRKSCFLDIQSARCTGRNPAPQRKQSVINIVLKKWCRSRVCHGYINCSQR